jgi:hypothetical protein
VNVKLRACRAGACPPPSCGSRRRRGTSPRPTIYSLNVGATRQQVAEVIFQQATYGGMPVVVDALDVLKAVLEERGEWEG